MGFQRDQGVASCSVGKYFPDVRQLPAPDVQCSPPDPPTTSPAPAPVTDSTCVLCEYVITTLDSMLEDKTNKDEIKASLEKLCSLLPSSVEKQCDTFVSTYTDLIIDMLTKDVSPEMICTNLGLCKSSGNIVQHRVDLVRLEAQKKPYCALCEMVITQLEQMLEDKTNEAEIEQALDVVCTALSAPVHKQCEKMVAKYTEKIIAMFVAEYTPEMLCGELALCVNNDINTNNIHLVDFDSDEVTAGETIGCEICEFAMTIVDQHLTNPSTVDEVERMVQFLCSYLPGTIADKCEEFVDQWGQKVIDLIVQDELNPSEVCGQIMPECSSQSGLRGRSCAWGPAYWCATPFHARACGTTLHCQVTLSAQPSPSLLFTTVIISENGLEELGVNWHYDIQHLLSFLFSKLKCISLILCCSFYHLYTNSDVRDLELSVEIITPE